MYCRFKLIQTQGQARKVVEYFEYIGIYFFQKEYFWNHDGHEYESVLTWCGVSFLPSCGPSDFRDLDLYYMITDDIYLYKIQNWVNIYEMSCLFI